MPECVLRPGDRARFGRAAGQRCDSCFANTHESQNCKNGLNRTQNCKNGLNQTQKCKNKPN